MAVQRPRIVFTETQSGTGRVGDLAIRNYAPEPVRGRWCFGLEVTVYFAAEGHLDVLPSSKELNLGPSLTPYFMTECSVDFREFVESQLRECDARYAQRLPIQLAKFDKQREAALRREIATCSISQMQALEMEFQTETARQRKIQEMEFGVEHSAAITLREARMVLEAMNRF